MIPFQEFLLRYAVDTIAKNLYKQVHIVFYHQVQKSLIGNPVKIGSGPAAVNGDEIR